MFFPLSAVNHYSFCPRRCALVHMECVWSENFFTSSGQQLHSKVDRGGSASRKDCRIAKSLRLFSRTLGVSGIADLVEFVRDDIAGVSVLGWQGRWMPYPVEYKWGTAKNEIPYRRQLCAQAICLEEMFHVRVMEGSLYIGVKKHRCPVQFDEMLRQETREVCSSIHTLLASGITPPPTFGKWCSSCSLIEECRPKLVASRRSVKAWLEGELNSTQDRLSK